MKTKFIGHFYNTRSGLTYSGYLRTDGVSKIYLFKRGRFGTTDYVCSSVPDFMLAKEEAA